MKITYEQFLILKKNLKANTETEVLSGSMHPFIKKGEYIKVSPYKMSDLKLGDVIIFWKNDKLICHLLMRVELLNGEYTLYTKGLNNSHYDEPTKESNYLGLVTHPRIGFIRRLIFKFLMRLNLLKSNNYKLN